MDPWLHKSVGSDQAQAWKDEHLTREGKTSSSRIGGKQKFFVQVKEESCPGSLKSSGRHYAGMVSWLKEKVNILVFNAIKSI